MSGDGLEGGPDARLALKWWVQAAELGHIHALYQAAASYEAGRGVSADPARAAELFLGRSLRSFDGNLIARAHVGSLACVVTNSGCGERVCPSVASPGYTLLRRKRCSGLLS